ncbi:hypothetical protein ARMGADRAFT_1165958 [Armillaria gallica]|uniref:Uncharacterized protein n=1 Tax=Armillaria gallica TaxID=47427 RepID=A0A2H3DVF6_ARMGA|nr:hypothetical protein ARMGADRAFT_1165958 [Armillaria gallica]
MLLCYAIVVAGSSPDIANAYVKFLEYILISSPRLPLLAPRIDDGTMHWGDSTISSREGYTVMYGVRLGPSPCLHFRTRSTFEGPF